MEQSQSRKLLIVVTVTFCTVLVTNFLAFRHEAPDASILSTAYAALSLFGATYLPLPPQETAPTSLISALGILSLAVTIFAVIVTLFGLLLTTYATARASLAKGALVILGDGQTAMGVLRRAEERLARQTADSRPPAVVLIAEGRVLGTYQTPPRTLNYVQSSLSYQGLSRSARRVIRCAKDVIVATDDNALNRELAGRLTQNVLSTNARVVGVISSPRYADELRPAVLDGSLPASNYTSPHHNVAQFIASVIDAISLDTAADQQSDLIVQIDDLDGGAQEELWAVELVLARLSSARVSILPSRAKISVLVVSESTRRAQVSARVDIHILLAGDPAEVAASLLSASRHRFNSSQRKYDSPIGITIGVTDARLFRNEPVHERPLADNTSGVRVLDPDAWPCNFKSFMGATLAIDRNSVGYDDGLILDTLESYWGRSYHNAHGFMYRATAPWNYHLHGRNEQSSIAAVKTMLEQLAVHGYALYRTSSWPQHTLLSGSEVSALARAEHEAWRKRRWTDPTTGRVLRAPQKLVSRKVIENSADRPYAELDERTRAYNERVPLEIYPAVAASMGYEIRRRISKSQLQDGDSASGSSDTGISL